MMRNHTADFTYRDPNVEWAFMLTTATAVSIIDSFYQPETSNVAFESESSNPCPFY